MNARQPAAFTLLEVLAVVALIAAFSAYVASNLVGTGETAAVRGAQASLLNLLTVARTQAATSGRKTRVLVAADRTHPAVFLRRLTLQLARQSGSSPTTWDLVTEVNLPEGVFVVPPAITELRGLVDTPAQWKRESEPSIDLSSDLFRGQALAVTFPGAASAEWCVGVAYTPNGTLAALGSGVPPKGFVVLAPGRRRAPGTFAADESPVILRNPDAARGLVLSAYGVPARLDDRRAF